MKGRPYEKKYMTFVDAALEQDKEWWKKCFCCCCRQSKDEWDDVALSKRQREHLAEQEDHRYSDQPLGNEMVGLA